MLDLFNLVAIGNLLIMYLLPVGLFLILARPRALAAKVIVTIVLSWITHIAYTFLVYIPVGRRQDIEDAHMKFDNNVTAVTLFFGWMPPGLSLCIFFWPAAYGGDTATASASLDGSG